MSLDNHVSTITNSEQTLQVCEKERIIQEAIKDMIKLKADIQYAREKLLKYYEEHKKCLPIMKQITDINQRLVDKIQILKDIFPEEKLNQLKDIFTDEN